MRTNVRLLAALAAASLLLIGGTAAARDLRISHQFPGEGDNRDRAARLFAEEVQKELPSFKFSIHPLLSLKVKAEEQFDALKDGRIEMAVYPLPYAVKKVPEFSLAVLPGLFPRIEAARYLKGSRAFEYLQTAANKHGVHILAWWWVPGGFATSVREIAGPETVKGLKIRSGDPLFDLMLQKAGATPVEMTSNKLRDAMKDGVIDGTLTSYETFVTTRIYEQSKFFTGGSPHIWMFPNTLLISKAVWDSMSGAERRIFEDAAEKSEQFFLASQQEAERRFIEAFTKAGAKFHRFTRADYSAWLALAQDTAWAEYLRISPEARAMLFETMQAIMSSPAMAEEH